MHHTIVAVMLLAACGADPGGSQEGPALGYWTPASDRLYGWRCNPPGAGECVGPPPFSTAPLDVRIGAAGAIEWNMPSEVIEHNGDLGTWCIDVPAATERGHEREPYLFCTLHDEMDVAIPGRAAAVLRWDAGTGDECWCGGYFDYAGPE